MVKYKIIKKNDKYYINKKFIFWWYNPFTYIELTKFNDVKAFFSSNQHAIDFLINTEKGKFTICMEGEK